jgi:GWxTD domain-containing protein
MNSLQPSYDAVRPEETMVSFQDRRNRVVVFLLFFLTTIPVFAGLSPELQAWGDGPVQWIMTSDEQRAWRKVATDTDAIDFIDLFWVRRDPSPGTAINEFRNEFDNRVAFSNKTFKEKKKIGSMSDRGRVYIVLGAATSMTGAMRGTNAQQGVKSSGGNIDPSGGRQMGERDIWIWEHADARKYDMGRIEVVFIEDPTTRSKRRDPQRTDFGLAGTVAIRKAIVNPELTSVPAWAPTGGLKPVTTITIAQMPANDRPVPVAVPVAPPEASVSFPDEGPAVASNAPGASRLTLLASGSINARSSTDPFAVKSETSFQAGNDVPWAVQFCSAKAEVPKLTFMLVITGPLDGASTEQMTRRKDAKAERMAAQPGCYVLQGMLPASKLGSGRYKLTVLLDDPVTGDDFTVKREFRIE